MSWLDTPIAAALARALVHFIWEGAVIAALLAVMLAALRGASAQSRYVAACAAMAAMAASFVATAVGSGPEGRQFSAPVAAVFAWPDPALRAGGGPSGPVRPVAVWAVAIWLIGVGGLLLRRSGGWLRARRMLSRATVAAEAHWTVRLDGLRARMGIAREVVLVESALAEGPAVMGWLRPAILVPAGWLMGLPPEQVESVLLHELAHVRRHDYLVNLIQSAVEDVLFYHPAVWWVGGVIRRERENCCDDAAVAMGADRRTYARTLASLEGLRVGEPALAAAGGSLTQRIRRLVLPPTGPRASAAPLVLAMAFVCAGAATLPALQTRPSATAPTTSAQPAVPAPLQHTNPAPARPLLAMQSQQERRETVAARTPDPYEKWLTQDVAYIIEDRERAAFRALQSQEEKEHFIEQFWARRGTSMKQEHYRRIAYANDHYPGGIPGWKTDRGRIYITYGPPDEKESHPSGDRGGPPYEEWLYHKLEGVGDNVIVRFEDEKRDGTFRMTMDPNRPRAELTLPPRVVPAAAMTLPAIQSNGDYAYRSGPAEVRVGTGGATLIRVDSKDVHLTLNRVTRHDGGGEVVLREAGVATGDGDYEKLLTLPAGVYRLEAEMTGDGVEARAQAAALTTQVEKVRAQSAAATQIYTPQHPAILQLRTQLANLLTQLAYAQQQKGKGPSVVRMEFRVP